MLEHMNNLHDKNRFKCRHCEFSINFYKGLREHIKNTHVSCDYSKLFPYGQVSSESTHRNRAR